MAKASTKQRCIRFVGDLEERITQQAEEEGRTFSAQVNWLLRQSLAQRRAYQDQQTAA